MNPGVEVCRCPKARGPVECRDGQSASEAAESDTVPAAFPLPTKNREALSLALETRHRPQSPQILSFSVQCPTKARRLWGDLDRAVVPRRRGRPSLAH